MKEMVMALAGFSPDWQDKRIYHSKRRWTEVCFKFGGPALHLSQYGDRWHTLVVGLIFVTFYIKVPRFINSMECMESGYGFSFTEDSIQLNWAKKTKVLWYPWTWDFHARWERVEKAAWVRQGEDDSIFVQLPRHAHHGTIATKNVHDFTYVLKNGTVQRRKATIYVDRMEWRWRALKWLPFPRLVRTSINIDFDGEVGERSGSWKGGCTGCSYEIKPGETPEQALRRMERERKFT